MDHEEKRLYLIKYLLAEHPGYKDMQIPDDAEEQKRLLRSLFNVRMPGDISPEFLKVQDEYLKEAIQEKGITDAADLDPS